MSRAREVRCNLSSTFAASPNEAINTPYQRSPNQEIRSAGRNRLGVSCLIRRNPYLLLLSSRQSVYYRAISILHCILVNPRWIIQARDHPLNCFPFADVDGIGKQCDAEDLTLRLRNIETNCYNCSSSIYLIYITVYQVRKSMQLLENCNIIIIIIVRYYRKIFE